MQKTSILIADPQFLKDFGLTGDTVKMGIITSAFLFAYSFSGTFLSSLGDRLGPRVVTSITLVMWAIAMLMGGLTTSFAVLIISRIILGLGEGVQWSMLSRYCRNWFPTSELGKANSVWLVGAKVGPVISVPVFSYIVAMYNWHVTFYVMSVLSILVMVIIWIFAKDYPEQTRWVNKNELDYIRSEGLIQEQSREEKRADFKRNLKFIITNANFWNLTISYCVQASIFYGMLTWLPSYLKIARGFSRGRLWAVIPL